jgi:4-hydroxy-2-oxoheptanedioate aldolase
MKNALERGGKWNRLKSLWREDRTALGVLATIPSPAVVQVIARAGLDFIFLDMEHGPIDVASLHAMIAATQGTHLVPLVRVGALEPWLAKLPLDLGALGVCFPMINTRAAAETAVKAVRYPPEGERYWGPFYAAHRWQTSPQEYTKLADEEVLSIGMIEHIDAVESIADIVAVPGFDLAIIGAGDLSSSMGLQGQTSHPDVAAAIARVEAPIRDSAVILGGVAIGAEKINAMKARGYRALIVGFDWLLMQQGIEATLKGIER